MPMIPERRRRPQWLALWLVLLEGCKRQAQQPYLAAGDAVCELPVFVTGIAIPTGPPFGSIEVEFGDR
jgi:hypothetical protein